MKILGVISFSYNIDEERMLNPSMNSFLYLWKIFFKKAHYAFYDSVSISGFINVEKEVSSILLKKIESVTRKMERIRMDAETLL